MNATELKISLFRRIDQLDDNEQNRLYGDLMNVINGTIDTTHWQNLSEAQRNGITDAVRSIESGAGMVHENVMEKYRKRYSK